MPRLAIVSLVVLCALANASCATRASEPYSLTAATLQTWAEQPWDKATLMHTTVALGRYQGVPVVAEHPCSDVCPQYTIRVIHYQLPPEVTCASVGGVEQQVLVPIAITVLPKTFCIPKPLLASGRYYAK
ncbi:MAG: hypothetical protein ABI114_17075 [Rhodanobacter sp.]